MAAKVYHDKDADLKVLKGKTMAVIGFGSQGHAHALNLKDSGVNVIIGLYKGSKSAKVAKAKGFKVYSNAEAVKRADVIFVAVPDTRQAEVYKDDIKPNLAKGKTLLFSHGFAIHFKTVTPPKDINVILVAPKGPGHIVRRQYVEGKGVPSLIAIYQNADRQAKKIALAWAKGIGGTRAGVIQTTFKEETETDLFGEQTVLCGRSEEHTSELQSRRNLVCRLLLEKKKTSVMNLDDRLPRTALLVLVIAALSYSLS